MTKRSHASAASSQAELTERQTSYDDGERGGSHEDGDGSALKKPRSFMATLVCGRYRILGALLTRRGLRHLQIEEDAM
jgi:hypothetical protein